MPPHACLQALTHRMCRRKWRRNLEIVLQKPSYFLRMKKKLKRLFLTTSFVFGTAVINTHAHSFVIGPAVIKHTHTHPRPLHTHMY
jgi:hypothetical protein